MTEFRPNAIRWLISPAIALALALAALAAEPLQGQDKVYEISDYHTRLELTPDGTYRVRERITFDFQVGSFTFAERNIPLANSDGVSPVRVVSPDVEISRVVQEAEGGDWRVHWEFPSRTDPTTFILEYEVYGAVRDVGETNEVFWRVVGEGWGVPLRQVEAEIVLPSALSVPAASLIPDPAEIATVEEVGGDVVARFRPGSLPPGRAYQVRVTFPKVLEGRPVGLARGEVRYSLLGLLAFLGTLGVGVVVAFRRSGVRLQARLHAEPDVGIPTAAVLLHRQAPAWERAFPATLFDLAERGVITLEHVDHRWWIFKNSKVLVRPNPDGQEPLTEFEAAFLEKVERLEYLNEFASKGRKFRSNAMKAVRATMVEDGYLGDIRSAANRAVVMGGVLLVFALVLGVVGAVGQPVLLALAGAAAGLGCAGLSVGTVRYPRTRKGAESLAAVRGHQQRLREELKQQLKMAPIQAAEFLFQHLAWLTLDPKYRGTESQKLRRRLKKERGDLRPPPWAIDRTEKFVKATANKSTAYCAFLCFSNVTGSAGGAVAPSSGGGAAGGASGGGAAGGGGGGAG